MRTINVSLNETKLKLKQQQLSQIETQLLAIKAKLEDVSKRYTAKQNEISQIETVLKAAQTAPVSK